MLNNVWSLQDSIWIGAYGSGHKRMQKTQKKSRGQIGRPMSLVPRIVVIGVCKCGGIVDTDGMTIIAVTHVNSYVQEVFLMT